MDKYKVIVSAGLPTSIKQVALRIANANNWEYRNNPFAVRDWKYLVYVSDPRLDTLFIASKLPADHVIVYLVSEGPIRTNLKHHLIDKELLHLLLLLKRWQSIKVFMLMVLYPVSYTHLTLPTKRIV